MSDCRAASCGLCKCALGLLLIALAFLADDAVRQWVIAHQAPPWSEVAGRISHFLKWPWLMLVCALLLAIAWRRGKNDAVRILLAVMIAASLAGLSADVLRGLTGRVRPRAEAQFSVGWHGPWREGRVALLDSNFHAFPSGHVSVVAGMVGVLWLTRRRVAWMLSPMLLFVAASRVYLGAHHCSDVAGAIVLGCAWAIAVTRWMNLSASSPACAPSSAVTR